jgi:hypothetical protein
MLRLRQLSHIKVPTNRLGGEIESFNLSLKLQITGWLYTKAVSGDRATP